MAAFVNTAVASGSIASSMTLSYSNKSIPGHGGAKRNWLVCLGPIFDYTVGSIATVSFKPNVHLVLNLRSVEGLRNPTSDVTNSITLLTSNIMFSLLF